MAFFTRKRIIKIAILIAILLLIWLIKTMYFGKQDVSYSTEPVKRGDIESSILATGILKPYQLVAVGARATGRVMSLKARPGQEVKEGDLLAEIDSTTQENDLKGKEAILAQRQASLIEQQSQLLLAQQNMQRQQNMIASHAISKADYDSAKAQLKSAEALLEANKAQVDQAKADVEMAQVNLSYTQVRAPFNGTVLATVVQEGQNVNAVQSAPTLVILGNLSVMTVRTEISEADIVHVKPGQELYFNTLGEPDRRYESKLEAIEPAPESIRDDISVNPNGTSTSSTNSQAVYYNGLFNVDNKDGSLKTYMTAEVHIVLGEAKNALLIPTSGLSGPDTNNKYHVRVLNSDNSVTTKQIEIGLKTPTQTEVISGLKEGEKIITGQTGAVSNSSKASSSKKPHF